MPKYHSAGTFLTSETKPQGLFIIVPWAAVRHSFALKSSTRLVVCIQVSLLVLKVAISSPEYRLSFVSFANSHPMVCIGKVELGKPPSSSQTV